MPHQRIQGPLWNQRFGSHIKFSLGGPGDGRCSWDCFYCTRREDRRKQSGWIDFGQFLGELEGSLKASRGLESLLLVGHADPSMHPEFATIIHALRDLRERRGESWVIGCLVNGSSSRDGRTLEALNRVDELFVKLDCAEDGLFERVNRPCWGQGPKLSDHLEGIRQLDAVNLHTTLWKCPSKPEFETWTTRNLEGLYRLYGELKPRAVYLTTVAEKKAAFELLPVNDSELATFGRRVEEFGIPVKVNQSFPVGEMSG